MRLTDDDITMIAELAEVAPHKVRRFFRRDRRFLSTVESRNIRKALDELAGYFDLFELDRTIPTW